MSLQAAAVLDDKRQPSPVIAIAAFVAIIFFKLFLLPFSLSRLFPETLNRQLDWWEAQPVLITLTQQICVIGLIIYLAGGFRALGLVRGKGLVPILKTAFLTFGLMGIVASGALHLALTTGIGLTSPTGITLAVATVSPWFALLVIALGAPIEEEFLVRGYVLPSLAKCRIGPTFAAIVSSFLWTGCHLAMPWYSLASTFVIGLFLSYARLSTGSLWPCIIAHSLFNTVPALTMALWPFFA
jgi:membrane protease YdiL (CAAX protease family)